VIVGVDDATIAEWIRSRLLVATDAGLETDAQYLAAEIGLIKAIRDWDLQRIITFHNRVKRAKRFSGEMLEISQWLDDEHKPTRSMWCDHVSGDMPTNQRRQKLLRLKEVGDNEVGLLSNARCLSEGVDVAMDILPSNTVAPLRSWTILPGSYTSQAANFGGEYGKPSSIGNDGSRDLSFHDPK
jgi:hypothetical protein